MISAVYEHREYGQDDAAPVAYIALYTLNYLGASAFFALPPAGLLSCSRLRGTQEARVNTGCKRGPWSRSVARALGVQSREIWQITTGSLSDHLEPTRPMQTRKTKAQFPPQVIFSFFVSGCCCYGTTAAIQAFPFMTAMNGASACGLV